jgi:hypothetical protein
MGSPYSSLFALLHLTRKAGEQVTLTVQNAGRDRGPLDDFPAAMQTGLDQNRFVSGICTTRIATQDSSG